MYFTSIKVLNTVYVVVCYNVFMKYIDTHSHLHDKALQNNLDFTILKMKEDDIYSITIGTDYVTSLEAKALAFKLVS